MIVPCRSLNCNSTFSTYRVLNNHERLRITFFSQSLQIFQHYFEKLHFFNFENRNYFPNVSFLFCLHVKTVSKCYFVSFVNLLLNTALYPSLNCLTSKKITDILKFTTHFFAKIQLRLQDVLF